MTSTSVISLSPVSEVYAFINRILLSNIEVPGRSMPIACKFLDGEEEICKSS